MRDTPRKLIDSLLQISIDTQAGCLHVFRVQLMMACCFINVKLVVFYRITTERKKVAWWNHRVGIGRR